MAGYCWARFEAIARERADHLAVVQGDHRETFRSLRARAMRAAKTLDIARGEHAILNAKNSIDFIVALLAIWARGGIPCFLHPDAPESHREHAIRLTAARYLLRDEPIVPEAACQTLILPLAADDTHPAPAPLPDDDATAAKTAPGSVVFTSGSTGLPKGVVQSQYNLVDGAGRVFRTLRLAQDDTLLCPIPFTFDYGWGQLLFCLAQGLTLILPEKANAFGTCEAIARHKPTILAAVPALASDLLSGLSPIRGTDTRSVRLITTTGSKMPACLSAQLLEVFPNAALSLNYGLTESYRSASLDPSLVQDHPDSVGTGIEGVDLRILRDDGAEAEVGERGQIIHRGNGIFLGYLGDQAATNKALRPDPFAKDAPGSATRALFTGDTGYLDSNGLLHVVGRFDGQLKSMGVRVSRDDIERHLMASGLLAGCAVIPRDHPQIGDLIVAIVALSHELDPNEALKALKSHANTAMSKYMVPRDWIVLVDIPRTANGKTDYPLLKRAHG